MSSESDQYWQLLQALPLAAVLVSDGKITGWNAAASVLYGCSEEQALGRGLVETVLDLQDLKANENLARLLVRGQAWSGDFRVRRSGDVLLVSSFYLLPLERTVEGLSRFVWIATDGVDHQLADQQREVLMSAEHAARTSAEQWAGFLEAVLGAAPVGIAVFDRDLRCIKVNSALVSMDGGTLEQYVDRYPQEHPGITSWMANGLREVIERRERVVTFEANRPTGTDKFSDRHFQFTYFPVLTAGNVLIGAGVTVVEVTESRRAEQERNRLLAQAAAATGRLSVLAAATSVLTTSMEVTELIERLAAVLVPRIANWCSIIITDDSGIVEDVVCQHQGGPVTAVLGGLVGQNIEHDRGFGEILTKTLVSGEAAFYARLGALDVFGKSRIGQAAATALSFPEMHGSVVVAPIQGRGRRLGVLVLGASSGRLNEEDLPLALEIAHRAALVVDNARVFGQERMVAETLQRSLLPSGLSAPDGVEIAARYLAGTAGVEVGGDWYDVVELGSHLLLVIGDVVGHDIAAASSMGQLRTAIRAYGIEDRNRPERTLLRLRTLVDTLDVGMASCFIASLDVENRTFRWANAGHPPPVCSDSTGTYFLEGDTGIILGAPMQGEVANDDIKILEPGTTLVFFTDGLVEVRGEDLSSGLARLRAVVSEFGHACAEDLCSEIVRRLLPSGMERSDDVAVLVVKVNSVNGVTGSLNTSVGPKEIAAPPG